MPEHDNIVLFAGEIADVIVKQRLGLESQSFENCDRARSDRLSSERAAFQSDAQSKGKVSCDSARPTPWPRTSGETHVADFADMRRP